jgi:PAS domain S-box-containing protein
VSPLLLPLWPVKAVDIGGSTLMIVLALLCVHHAFGLGRREPQSVIWTYLRWFALALLLFSVSRSVSHLIKYLLVETGRRGDWIALRPLTGSLNTISFVIVGSITLFFRRVHTIYRRTMEDKRQIEQAHDQIVRLNESLERRVLERTEELSASEEKYRRVFEGSKDMLVILDGEGRVLDLNRAGAEMLGYRDASELVGRNLFFDFFLEPSPEEVLKGLGRGDPVKDVEVRLRRSGGDDLLGLFSATVRDAGGATPSGIEVTIKDVTARRMMDSRLQQAEKLASLGQLSAGVAHEINNPLGLILGYTQLIMKEAGAESPSYEDLKVIEKHAMGCKKIVEDLLQFSRSMETSKRPSSINDLLDGVLRVLRGNFSKEGVVLEEQLDPDLPAVTVDAEKMEQVFMNLLINARQAIEKRGTVRVETAFEPGSGEITVSVSDNGSGIPKEVLPRIFDPFYTTKPTGTGTGLGLSVSYGIVQDHGGGIEVESTPGRGAVFTVRIPLDAGTPGRVREGRAGPDEDRGAT